jgi:glycosyltransferase involved in cell wall biosynthesis
MSEKKILFVSHEATRTGAPLSLLRLMKWIKENTNISFLTLLIDNKGNSGDLQSEFEALGSVLLFNQNDPISKFFKKLAYKTRKKSVVDWLDRQHLKRLKKQIVQENIDLIYANTIVNSQSLEFLSEFLNCPTICHVRELEWIIRLVGLKKFQLVKKHTQQYIAISEAVKKNLIENHKIAEDKIEVIYNGIALNTHNLNNSQLARERICQQLDIPQEAAIVCASGTTDWRKGTDLFVQLARAVNQQSLQTPVYFLWVGGFNKDIYIDQLKYDAKQLGLDKYVRFLGSRSNPLDYYAACDVFTLLSREEAFGMVCIEAASLGKPIICFDRAGGAQEFVENDCGFVVPYLDIEAMATKVVTLLNSPELYQSYSQRARQKVQERHDINITASKVFKVIEKSLS